MCSSHQPATLDDVDDFTYTEDSTGEPVKVPMSREYVYKVVFLGDYHVGKTSIIKRLLSLSHSSLSPQQHAHAAGAEESDEGRRAGEDPPTTTPTLGNDFYSLTLAEVVPGASVRLQIWDTAGLEKYAAQYTSTLRNISFLICVFDVTSPSSLHNVMERHLSIAAKYVPDLDQSHVMVVANKIDLLYDVVNNTPAFRRVRKRGQSPERAFDSRHSASTPTETDDDNSVIVENTHGAVQDAVVTAQRVQTEVLDLLGDVHYAEVSAKTGRHLRRMLRTLCYALLQNSTSGSSNMLIPERESPSEMLKHTALPLYSSTTSPKGMTASNSLSSSGPQPDTAKPEIPSPATQQKSTSIDNSSSQLKKNGAPPSVSWRAAGLFSFDIAPLHSHSSSDFSPKEGLDGSTEKVESSVPAPSNGAAYQGSPVELSCTEIPTPYEGSRRTRVSADESQGATNQRIVYGRDEDLKTRKVREQEEMKALLARVEHKKGNANILGTGADDSAVAPSRAEEEMQGNSAAQVAKDDGFISARQERPTFSILDSLGVSEDHKGGGVVDARNSESDDDEDGARLQAHLRDRFAQIEHGIRTDAAAAKLQSKEARKKSKTKGKCECCVL